MALVSFETWEPGLLGRVIRTADGERVTRIVEAKDASPDELTVGEVNAGLYAFDAAWLRAAVARLTPSPVTGELYLTQLVDLAVADGGTVVALEAPDDGTLDGINDRVQLAEATAVLRERINMAWMRAGVTMHDPATAFVDAEVELAPDVTLEPNVILRGRTRVGEGTVVGAGSQLIDAVVGPRCRIWASILEQLRRRGGGDDRPLQPPAPGELHRARRRARQLRRGEEQPPRGRREAAPRQLPRRRPRRRGDERRGGDDHRQLRRRPQAPHRDREGRLPRRRHDAAGPDHARRRREDRRGRRRHQGRPAGQARGRRPGAPARPPPASPPVDPASGPAPHRARRRPASDLPRTRRRHRDGHRRRPALHRRPDGPRGHLRRGRDRPRLDPAEPRRPARGRATAGRAARPQADRRSRSLPRGLPARPDDDRVLRLGLRRGEPRRLPGRASCARCRRWRGERRCHRPDRGDHPPRPLHDRLRGAGAEDARPRPPRAVRHDPGGPDRHPGPHPGPPDRASSPG